MYEVLMNGDGVYVPIELTFETVFIPLNFVFKLRVDPIYIIRDI